MTRTLIAVVGLALVAVTFWAAGSGALIADLRAVAAIPWGTQVLTDLYVGFFLASLVIFAAERNKTVALLWIVPIFFLGNLFTFVWFLTRRRRPD